MADPVSLTLAVLPLAVEVLKAYSLVHHKVKVVRSYSSQVDRVFKRIRQQKLLFESFWEVLLHDTRHDGNEAALMVGDLSHPDWQSLELEQRVQLSLRRISDCCATTMREMNETLKDADRRLQAFNVLYEERLEGEPLKETIRRVKRIGSAFKIAFNEKEYQGYIDELRDQNCVLRQLCGDADKLRRLDPVVTKPIVTSQVAPTFGSVKRASRYLHDALTEIDLGHFERPGAVKLCLEAKEVGPAICLDLVICRRQPPTGSDKGSNVAVLPLRQITVEAVDLDGDERSQIPYTGLERPRAPSSQAVTPQSRDTTLTGQASESNDQTDPSESCILVTPSIGSLTITTCTDIYQQLMHKACEPKISSSRCPGLYETCRGSYRQVFHSSADCSMKTCCSPIMPRYAEVRSLHEALQKPMHDVVGMTERLKLARGLTLGVLQYHSTGWLPDQWDAKDVSVFSEDEQLSAPALRTLHFTRALSSSLPWLPESDFEGCGKEGANICQRTQMAARNLILYNLGLQLLQIAHWSHFEAMDPARAQEFVEKHSIRPPLGKKYHEFVRRCIECDFGYGTRLESDDLQRAVYAGVTDIDSLIDPLEKLGL